jgi:N-acetylmuramoyl-L-alanine amidase
MRLNRREAITLALAALPCAGCAAAQKFGPVAATGSAGATAPGSESPSSEPASPSISSPASPSSVPLPLAGKVVGIDPGHNGGNFTDPGFINQLIWNGREQETCDTTGTQTTSGYTEALFNFHVASHLRDGLVAAGATVVMTRKANNGVGPCVNHRAEIINAAHADVAIDIHADGGPSWGRGFTVLEPVADGPNDKVIRDSMRFGASVRDALRKYSSMPQSDYYGHDGVVFRNDLAGLNLTTVPKVLVECGNMPNSTDAALLASRSFQQEIAGAFTTAIISFLTGRQVS